MPRRKVRDEDEARQFLEAAARSSLERAAWARQHGIDARSLNAWRLVLARRDKKSQLTSLRLVEVVHASMPQTPLSSPFHLRLDGLEVEVPADFDAGALSRLLDVLRAC